jgi:hypothetical protein
MHIANPRMKNMHTTGVPQLSHHALPFYFNPMSHSHIYRYTVSHKLTQVEYPILGRHFEIETSCFYLMVLKPETTKIVKETSKEGPIETPVMDNVIFDNMFL